RDRRQRLRGSQPRGRGRIFEQRPQRQQRRQWQRPGREWHRDRHQRVRCGHELSVATDGARRLPHHRRRRRRDDVLKRTAAVTAPTSAAAWRQDVTRTGNGPGRSRPGSPLDWCNADKALLVACVVLPFAVWHVGLQYYYLTHPEVAPYIDLEFVARTIRLQAIVWIGGWL